MDSRVSVDSAMLCNSICAVFIVQCGSRCNRGIREHRFYLPYTFFAFECYSKNVKIA